MKIESRVLWFGAARGGLGAFGSSLFVSIVFRLKIVHATVLEREEEEAIRAQYQCGGLTIIIIGKWNRSPACSRLLFRVSSALLASASSSCYDFRFPYTEIGRA